MTTASSPPSLTAAASAAPGLFPLVHIQGLRKRYGDNEVLKGVDLEVQRGEVISIIGKSGSGKSTLLRCINGLEHFQQGSLSVHGQPLKADDAPALREQLVAAGTERVSPLQATPFGPSFSFTGPEGYRLTVHGD